MATLSQQRISELASTVAPCARGLLESLQDQRPTPWRQHAASPAPNRVVSMRQRDFADGALRITQGRCIYRLEEDVEFHPNPTSNFMPRKDQGRLYPSPPYQLGFFAAIVVEADEVVIDLNGKMLAQSAIHALEQRFFACIELSSQPFIEGQGPSKFEKETTCHDVVVRNGLLGRSSHHGIHGVGCSDVLLENLQISDFEVGGIHLNGVERVLIRETSVGPTRSDVPVNAMYSNARFLMPHLTAILKRDPEASIVLWRSEEESCVCARAVGGVTPCLCMRGVSVRYSGKTIAAALEAAMAAVRRDVEAGVDVGTTDGWLSGFFAHSTKVTDGSAYGVVINQRGVAIDGFLTEVPEHPSRNVALCNVCVEGIETHLVEVVGVNSACTQEERTRAREERVYGAGVKMMAGPVGDVFRFKQVTDPMGRYHGNALTDAQLFIAKNAASDSEKGTTNLCPEAIEWAATGVPITTWLSGDPYYYVFNGDSMAHVSKGNIGVFIQGVVMAALQNVDVNGVEQRGKKGQGCPMKSHRHPKQNLLHYQGASARGVVFAGTRDVFTNDVAVRGVRSAESSAAGIEFIGSNDLMRGSDFAACNVRAVHCYPIRMRGPSMGMVGRCPARISTPLELAADHPVPITSSTAQTADAETDGNDQQMEDKKDEEDDCGCVNEIQLSLARMDASTVRADVQLPEAAEYWKYTVEGQPTILVTDGSMHADIKIDGSWTGTITAVGVDEHHAEHSFDARRLLPMSSEMPQLGNMFAFFDADESGQLTMVEMIEGLTPIGAARDVGVRNAQTWIAMMLGVDEGYGTSILQDEKINFSEILQFSELNVELYVRNPDGTTRYTATGDAMLTDDGARLMREAQRLLTRASSA